MRARHVVDAPMNTYHVNATVVHPQTMVIAISPAIMPTNAFRSPTSGSERAEQERAEHRAGRERQDGEAGIEDRAMHQLRADARRRSARCPRATVAWPRHAHLRGLIGVGPNISQIEIVDRRRGHRVERRRQRGGDNRRDDESGEAVCERGHDEDRQNLVRCGRAVAAAAFAGNR